MQTTITLPKKMYRYLGHIRAAQTLPSKPKFVNQTVVCIQHSNKVIRVVTHLGSGSKEPLSSLLSMLILLSTSSAESTIYNCANLGENLEVVKG